MSSQLLVHEVSRLPPLNIERCGHQYFIEIFVIISNTFPNLFSYLLLSLPRSTILRQFNVTVKAPVGELIQPVTINEAEFFKQQGKTTFQEEYEQKI